MFEIYYFDSVSKQKAVFSMNKYFKFAVLTPKIEEDNNP